MTKKTKDFFCTAVSDKDFIFGTICTNEYVSEAERLVDETEIGSAACPDKELISVTSKRVVNCLPEDVK